MNSERNRAMDNLRVIVIFLVVVLHGIISYMASAPPWWYVLDPQRTVAFTFAVLLIDVPIMQIMFFLAGYYACPSLAKRGAGPFFKDKVRRIGIPWVIGVFLLAPPTAYMIYFSRNIPMSLWRFWQTDFWGKAFQQSVYWYLGVLLALFAATAVLHATNRRFATWKPRVIPPSWRSIGLFVLAISAVSIAIAKNYGLDQWSNNYVFVYQPVRIPNYIGYFALGVFGHQCGWFAGDGYRPRPAKWVPWWILSGGLYVMYRMSPQGAAPTFEVKIVAILLFNVFCFSSLMAMIALVSRYFAGDALFWRFQARNSYGVYYLHPLILYPLALVFVPFAMSIYIKALSIILLAYGISLLASDAVLTRLPGARRMFASRHDHV